MSFYRGTWFFQFGGQPPCGFSESWEFEAASDALAIAQLQPFFKERAGPMSNDWTIIGARLSRLSAVLAPDCKIIAEAVQMPICFKQQAGLIASDADTPWAAVLVDINTQQATPSLPSPPRPRRWQCRGIPDSWWQGVLQIPADEAGKLLTFCKYLKDGLGAGKVKANSGCNGLGIQLYTACCIKRISNRQIGRPFNLLRGRRRAVAAS